MKRIALFVFAFIAAAAGAEEIALENFFRLPQYADMRLSPDGQQIAALAPFKGRQNLFVLDISATHGHPVTSVEIADVVWFDWLSSRRLVFWTGSLTDRKEVARPSGLFAVDQDAAVPIDLFRAGDPMARRDVMGGTLHAVARPVFLVRRLPGDKEEVILQEMVIDSSGKRASTSLYRVDSRSGRRRALGIGKPDSGETEHWVVDDQGVPRAFTAYRKGHAAHYYRAGPEADWTKIGEHSLAEPGMDLLAMHEDGKSLYVSAYGGRDKAAIYKWSPDTGALGEPVAAHPQVDLDRLVFDEGRPVGVSYAADRRGVAWFDATLTRVQQAVDKALPETVNEMSWSRDRKRFLVRASSDVSPGSFHLLDLATGKLQFLADRAPWIKPAEMAPSEALRYKARDGLEIPAYLTLPRGAARKALPLVVVVHGGPWVDGVDGSFDAEAQFLASRGYAVLQPNFRGTTRYGWRHFRASFRQWGLAMQDDLADAVAWAVDAGIADPKRVCIYGASYGGYAAMMGLAKTPSLYRCAVNAVGVTDIYTMLTASWSDFAYSDYIDYLSKDLLGDPSKDRAAMDAVSPAKLAASIRSPILMAYGGDDRRVPLVHGTMMKRALDAAGRPYEWMEFSGEGHGFRSPENRAAYYGAVERFLKANLAP